MSWGRFLEIGLGVLGWSPSEFWKATPCEFWYAFSGWQMVNTVKKPEGQKPPTLEETEDMKRRFDGSN